MEQEKKKTRNMIIIAALAIPILVIVGVFVGVYFANPNAQEPEPEEEVELDENTIPLEEFILNIESKKSKNKYIRMDVSLSTIDEEDTKIIEANDDKVRDIIIHTVSKESAENILNDEDGTQILKKVIRDSVNESFEKDLIHQVYITNIVMQ